MKLMILALVVFTTASQAFARVSTDQHEFSWKGITNDGVPCRLEYYNQDANRQAQISISEGNSGTTAHIRFDAEPVCDYTARLEGQTETYRYLLPVETLQEVILTYRDSSNSDLQAVTFHRVWDGDSSVSKQCRRLRSAQYLSTITCRDLVPSI
ncbi:MAG TPA: hypothetical protein VJB59_15700 [Bdellovibrionota bacterium]|nr:hypothetical protein [Bdellovibrionota bacterium]